MLPKSCPVHLDIFAAICSAPLLQEMPARALSSFKHLRNLDFYRLRRRRLSVHIKNAGQWSNDMAIRHKVTRETCTYSVIRTVT